MKIRYKDRKLEKMVNDTRNGGHRLQRKHGNYVADNVIRRLKELCVAANLLEMVGFSDFHSLQGDRQGTFAVRASAAMRLVFMPGDNPLPCKEDGGLNLGKVKEIVIIELVNYHA